MLACNSILPFGGGSAVAVGDLPVYPGATELNVNAMMDAAN